METKFRQTQIYIVEFMKLLTPERDANPTFGVTLVQASPVGVSSK